MKIFGKTWIVCALVFAGFVLSSTIAAQPAPEKPSGTGIKVGVFDSRAVATAYYRSESFKSQIKELKAERDKAKAKGDKKRVKALDAEGEVLQALAHKQGFSTWPVDDILEKIKDQLPEIAKETGVDIIISRWAIAYQQPDMQFVDVTDLLVQLFNPDEETLKIVKKIQKQDPVPLEKIEKHQHK